MKSENNVVATAKKLETGANSGKNNGQRLGRE